MELFLSSHHIGQLIDYANNAHPHECCGLLLGSGDVVTDILLTQNISSTPATHFEIDPASLFAAQRAERDEATSDRKLIGYFHSHPNGRAEPSAQDAECAIELGIYWVIIANNGVKAWRTEHGGALLGRFAPVNVNS